MPSGGGGGGDQDGRWRHADGRRPECVEGPDAVTSGEWGPGGQILHRKPVRSNSMEQELSVVNRLTERKL
jgi:hypothetical protein